MAEHAAEHAAYPVGLRLSGRRVVVLGAGQVAQRRLPSLVAAGADVLLISPSATPSVEAMADAGEIRWERRRYQDGDLAGAWYALISTDDPEANAAASQEAEDRRVWCVRSDDAEAATAWTPATGRSEGVTVAVLTGRDPRRSAAVRDAIVEGLRDGSIAAPHHRRPHTPGVALVGGGPGDPDLITVRGRRLLAEADVVIADRLGPRDLLAELPPHVEVIDAAKIPYGRFMAQEAINNALIEHAKAGKAVVRLKGATRSSSAAAWRRPRRSPRPASPARSSRASPAPSPCPAPPASRSPTAGSPTSSPSSAAMSPPTTSVRSWTGPRWPSCAAPSWS